jgi:signal transduction histidine kinase
LLRAELDFALHDASTEAELRDALRVASDETDRLTLLAGDLLLIAGSERGKLPLRREVVMVRDLLDSVRNRFAWRAADAGRDISVEVAGDLSVEGDRLRLEQALGNLVENALRYGAGTVLISARTAAGAIELHVQDEGPGLSAHFVPLAFHRFSRADESHAGSGAGLGLAIVDAIAVAHGGSAHVGARASDGGFDQTADIWISLPMTELVKAR